MATSHFITRPFGSDLIRESDPNPVLTDCRLDSVIDGTYTRGQLLEARDALGGADLYNDCFDAINAALARTPGEGQRLGLPGGSGADGQTVQRVRILARTGSEPWPLTLLGIGSIGAALLLRRGRKA